MSSNSASALVLSGYSQAATSTVSTGPLSPLESLALELKEKVLHHFIPHSEGCLIAIQNSWALHNLQAILPLTFVSKTLRQDVINYLQTREYFVLGLYDFGRPYALPAPGIPQLHLNLVKHINLDVRQGPNLGFPLDLSKASFPSLEKLVLIWPNTQTWAGMDAEVTRDQAKWAAVGYLAWLFHHQPLHTTLLWLKDTIENGNRAFDVHHKVAVSVLAVYGPLVLPVDEIRCLVESVLGEGENGRQLKDVLFWPVEAVSRDQLAAFMRV